jgi:ribosomal peptide maturation radical SAM protein 1
MRLSDTRFSATRHPLKTVILVMPFGLISFPEIGISSLKAFFRQHGYPLDIKYCNLEFARRIGFKEYEFYANLCNPYLVSEYPFATDLNPELPAYADFIRKILPPAFGKRLGSIRNLYHDMLHHMDSVVVKARDYLDDLEEQIDLSSYDVIGFTSSYAQNSASWALAKRLRRRYPDATIVIGGANCEGAMAQGQVDAFDFIDYACNGEGELGFLELVKWLEDPERNEFPTSGMVSRQRRDQSGPPRFVDVSTLPVPDYEDYFRDLDQYGNWRKWYHALPLESSRGCWWGQKVHCIFCGLNGQQMAFRQKPAQKFVDELREVRTKYGEKAKYIQVVDNIMPHKYFDEFLPLVTETRPYDTLFYEIKSNLRPHQIKQLRDAGVTFLQPGIESLSTPVLKIMRKGVTAMANVQTLKFATESGVWLIWSILCGFPGEKPEYYEEMAALMPKLYHLNPPRAIGEITIDRHSPLHQFPEQYGLHLEPAAAYKYLYGLSDHILADLAYWFEDTNRQHERMLYYQLPDYAKSCQRRIQLWKNAFLKLKNVRFDYTVDGDELHLVDSRSGVEHEVTLSGLRKALVESTMHIASFTTIRESLCHTWPAADDSTIRDTLEELVEASYILREGKQYLFLGLDRAELDAQQPSGFWLEKIKSDEDYTFA